MYVFHLIVFIANHNYKKQVNIFQTRFDTYFFQTLCRAVLLVLKHRTRKFANAMSKPRVPENTMTTLQVAGALASGCWSGGFQPRKKLFSGKHFIVARASTCVAVSPGIGWCLVFVVSKKLYFLVRRLPGFPRTVFAGAWPNNPFSNSDLIFLLARWSGSFATVVMDSYKRIDFHV